MSPRASKQPGPRGGAERAGGRPQWEACEISWQESGEGGWEAPGGSEQLFTVCWCGEDAQGLWTPGPRLWGKLAHLSAHPGVCLTPFGPPFLWPPVLQCDLSGRSLLKY